MSAYSVLESEMTSRQCGLGRGLGRWSWLVGSLLASGGQEGGALAEITSVNILQLSIYK